jgi:hypothetical protein
MSMPRALRNVYARHRWLAGVRGFPDEKLLQGCLITAKLFECGATSSERCVDTDATGKGLTANFGGNEWRGLRHGIVSDVLADGGRT